MGRGLLSFFPFSLFSINWFFVSAQSRSTVYSYSSTDRLQPRLLTTTTYYSRTTSAIQVQEAGLLLPATGLPKFLIGIISVFHANFQWHMGFYMYYYLKAVFT
jgi:hypothetical protein